MAVQESKYEKANRNLMEAENLLREKDEDLKVVQREFDAVMEERQVIYKILRIYGLLRSQVNIELKIFLNSQISKILKICNEAFFAFSFHYFFCSTFFYIY